MVLIVPLQACGVLPETIVGGKARTLGRMLDAGLSVPDGICLTTSLFELTRAETPLGSIIAEQLQLIASNPVRTGKALETIRNAILSTKLPDHTSTMVASIASRLLERGPVVVRSSTPHEDGRLASHAGIFHSELDVRDLEGVFGAIQRCWMSLFSEQALYYGRENVSTEMAIIIQAYVRPSMSGVMFTIDPVNGTNDTYIEVNFGGNESITTGKGAALLLHLHKGEGSNEQLPKLLVDALLSIIGQVEELVGGPADIEWAWEEEKLSLFQARPVTTGPGPTSIGTVWADQEEVAEVRKLPLGKCERLFIRQMQKKVWYRQFCRQAGIATFMVGYLVYDEEGLHARGEEILGRVHMPYVRVHWGDYTELTTRQELLNTLLAGRHHNPVGDGRYSCAQVGDVIPGDSTGFATCLVDSGVLIEAYPAGLGGLKEGSLTPSTFIVDREGKIVASHLARFYRRGVLSTEMGDWWESHVPDFALDLTGQEVTRISRAVTVLTKQFGEVRLEWYTYQGDVYVKDLSIETNTIEAQGSTVVLSTGAAAGVAIMFPELDALDELGSQYGISVVNYGGRQDEVYALDVFKRLREMSEGGEALIGVAEYPSIGLIPAFRYMKGFVFTRGTLLCHAAIVLRELGLPAVIAPDAANTIMDGDRVTISPEGILIVQ